MTLVQLRSETFAASGAGFAASTSAAWRYVNETIDALADRSPSWAPVLARVRLNRLPYLILDGTIIVIDRVAADRPFCSGKLRKHGVNPQVITDPNGELRWISGPLSGAAYDLAAARIRGIIPLAGIGLLVLADKA